MTDTMRQITRAETNRLIRADLKATYPEAVFTVRSVNGAGVTQTVIGWEINYRPTAANFDGYYSPPPARSPLAQRRSTLTPWRPAIAPGMEWRLEGLCSWPPGGHRSRPTAHRDPLRSGKCHRTAVS